MKLFAVSSILLLVGYASAEEAVIDAKCDRILGSIADGCHSISKQLLAIKTMTDPNAICCTNVRYQICVQSAKAYAAVARVTKICPEEHYVGVVDALENNPLLEPIKLTCKDFETQRCITKQANSFWDNIKTNVDVDKIGTTINRNWHETVDSISNIAKDIGKQFEEKGETFGSSIKNRAREFGDQFKNRFGEGTQKLKDMFAGGDASNRYSMVDDDLKSNDESGFDSIVHSIIPDVEFVEKSSDKIQEEPKSKQDNSFMDFFHSIAGTLESPTQKATKQAVEKNSNPYSVV